MNFRHLFLALLAAGLAGAGFGCARQVVVAEVLQRPQNGKIYTRYNLWYQDPEAISCLNPQQGRVLPIGTEVEPVYADERNLEFKDNAGTLYHIDFDPGLRMMSMRDFIQATLTLTPPDELLKNVSERSRKYIETAVVAPGMNRQEVTFACGPAPACRTPTPLNATWIYWITPDQTIRVNFRGDTVGDILNSSAD